MAGKLPREKDMFDYLRERMGYKTNYNESDISLHRLQERFKEAQVSFLVETRRYLFYIFHR